MWPGLVGKANAATLAAFGVPITFSPQDGSGAQGLKGIENDPPGVYPGDEVVRIWLDIANVTPKPTFGDQVTYNGVAYVVQDITSDDTGTGATLKLRAT